MKNATENQVPKGKFSLARGLLVVGIVAGICLSDNLSDRTYWTYDAIWYQIFPERFRNGDPTNDPTIETLEGTWPYEPQTQWSIMPWTADWYKLQPWEKSNQRDFYYNAQLRRYGGDIEGIIDKLDYLVDLGINAIYLNPVFESASSHKYGATMYHHIDNNFGPDPAGDIAIWQTENPNDPSTWQWTSADKLFLKLIQEVHTRQMKIIIDGVFNHVGIPFWAFQDVKKNGEASPYADWFVIKSFDDPSTIEDEFEYQGWNGIPDLPEIWEDENGPVQGFRAHIKAVVERWGDPNGDGDPSDGIDGWRLDVAEKVSKNFWRDFRKWVKSINPEAYLTGEIWWEDFMNNKMFDASPWLQGDIFDGVMNYRFGDAMLKAFIDREMRIKPSELDQLLGDIREKYPLPAQYQLQNIIGSHDNERFASMLLNPDRWIDHGGNLVYNKDFKINRPSDELRQIQKTILVFQFTYIGAPYIYYGDEVGMWGADDPDNRKPMVWDDMQYEPETTHPFGIKRPVDSVKVDTDLFNFYKSVINLRKNHECLRRGRYKTILTDDKKGIFGFERKYGTETIYIFANLNDKPFKMSEINFDVTKCEKIFTVNTDTNYLGSKGIVVYKIIEG
ncbi:MAG: glycoside hydrolase family 13 protein [Candidatus Marinimicrobia bacterium]|nr:glycoside hydrolase family 13 protein [Candidatus Neomarinimicrobiota bacterium]